MIVGGNGLPPGHRVADHVLAIAFLQDGDEVADAAGEAGGAKSGGGEAG